MSGETVFWIILLVALYIGLFFRIRSHCKIMRTGSIEPDWKREETIDGGITWRNMSITDTERREYLISKGWYEKPASHAWRWIHPKYPAARYTLWDAYDLAYNTSRERIHERGRKADD